MANYYVVENACKVNTREYIEMKSGKATHFGGGMQD